MTIEATPESPVTSPELLTVRVAELYYNDDRTMDEIGAALGITRWKVGRLLALARETGIVRISIVHPDSRRLDLEQRLRDRFGLRDAVVVAGESAEARVPAAAASYLGSLGLDSTVLGISWGRTVTAVSAALADRWAGAMTVVQVNGGVSLTTAVDSAAAAAVTIARKAAGGAVLLPSPAILERAETRRVIEADRTVAAVLAQAARASVYLFSAGVVDSSSALVESGYLTPSDLEGLVARGAVGDVLGRYIDSDGRIVDHDLDDRTIGLRLEQLPGADRAILVVAGTAKHPIARAVVASGLCSVLVTDEATATALLADAPSTTSTV